MLVWTLPSPLKISHALVADVEEGTLARPACSTSSTSPWARARSFARRWRRRM